MARHTRARSLRIALLALVAVVPLLFLPLNGDGRAAEPTATPSVNATPSVVPETPPAGIGSSPFSGLGLIALAFMAILPILIRRWQPRRPGRG
jgi:hypothetical protein